MRLKKKHLVYLLIAIILWIVLPTGTPEDAVTTLLFIKMFGFQNYLLMIFFTLLICWWIARKFGVRIKI